MADRSARGRGRPGDSRRLHPLLAVPVSIIGWVEVEELEPPLVLAVSNRSVARTLASRSDSSCAAPGAAALLKSVREGVTRKVSRRPCILVTFPKSDFTYVEWGATDRSAPGRQRPLSSKGRRTIPKQTPNGCLGRLSPHLARKGQCSTQEV